MPEPKESIPNISREQPIEESVRKRIAQLLDGQFEYTVFSYPPSPNYQQGWNNTRADNTFDQEAVKRVQEFARQHLMPKELEEHLQKLERINDSGVSEVVPQALVAVHTYEGRRIIWRSEVNIDQKRGKVIFKLYMNLYV